MVSPDFHGPIWANSTNTMLCVGTGGGMTHLFCEFKQVWKTQIVDDISGPDQHTAPVLLQLLKVICVAAVAVKLMEDVL